MKIMKKRKKDQYCYNTFQNILFVLNGIKQNEPVIFIYLGFSTLFLSVSPLNGTLFPRYILEELLTQRRIHILAFLVVLFFLISAICAFFTDYLKGLYFPRISNIRFWYLDIFYKKCMDTDFQNTEDAAFLNEMKTAVRCLRRSDTGVEGIINSLFNLFGSLLSLALFSYIITSFNFLIMLFLIFDIGITYLVTYVIRMFENGKKDELSDNQRRFDYIKSIMFDFKYGKEIRIYVLSSWIQNLFHINSQKIINLQQRIQSFSFRKRLLSVFMIFLRDVLVYGSLVYNVITEIITIPEFSMYVMATVYFSVKLQNVVSEIAYLRTQSADLNDLRLFIDKPDLLDRYVSKSLPDPPYTFRFVNVSFHYPNQKERVLNKVNCTINSGQKIALIGENGAGKSTFVKLMMRLYDCTDGQILLNEVDIKEFDKNEYYTLFSTVFQEIKPLAFSIYENITLDHENEEDRHQVEHCLKQAGLLSKINTLENGMDTNVFRFMNQDGIELSGGENQKLLIARALYKDGHIAIFDEPTAALDPLAERQMYENLSKIFKDKTTIFISHRLASTQFCDCIYFLDKGEIIEMGSHQELLEKQGTYAKLFHIQSQYYSKG
jgi:ATP-binding cassette subfamily C protein